MKAESGQTCAQYVGLREALAGERGGTGGQKSELKTDEVASQVPKGPEGRGKR